jgi:transposase
MQKQIASISRKTSVGREERVSAQNNSSANQQAFEHEVIKVAIDAHSKLFMASRQVENATPQPPQKFTRQKLADFIAKQVKLARRVVCCYEAGCFGYGLQRQLTALGAQCLVIAPQDWDERHKKVSTDRTDTHAMVLRLDRYVAGNTKALAVVRVPDEDQEVQRSRVRQRDQFLKDRNIWANRGKSLLCQYDLPASWSWWKPDHWEQTQKTVAEQKPQHAQDLLKMLQDFRDMLMLAWQKLEALTQEQQERQKQKKQEKERQAIRIKGIGELSMAKIEAEIGDWKRFSNRRQVASYTGLCPGVSGTGGKFTGLSINRCGNRRLRSVLVELAWLLPMYQPRYLPLLQWKGVLASANRSARKKAIVALARRLMVDLWRIHTGQCSAEKLGLKLAA